MDDKCIKNLIEIALSIAYRQTNLDCFDKIHTALINNFEIIEIKGLEIK